MDPERISYSASSLHSTIALTELLLGSFWEEFDLIDISALNSISITYEVPKKGPKNPNLKDTAKCGSENLIQIFRGNRDF